MKSMSLRVLVILATAALVLSMGTTASVSDIAVTGVTVLPESVEVGEDVKITATVENAGITSETVPIVFKINGEEVKTVNVTVEANATEMVNCTVKKDAVGTYTVTIGDESATFEVTTPSPYLSSREDNLTESIIKFNASIQGFDSKIGQLLMCTIIVIALACGLLGMMIYVHFIKPKKSKSIDTEEEIKKLYRSVDELKEEVKNNVGNIEKIREFIEERFMEERHRRER